ncbi:MAG TPA: ABC transporter substrate-binding protein [Ktedonobacteraceae bacterium]|nr:ABC transporter substrate-binding protein [Ktedonobacteraceae bacterium]
MDSELNRRTFLKRSGQIGGIVAFGGTLEALLAACGGNVTTTTGSGTVTPGTTVIASQGLKEAGLLQWGADYVSGAPYVFKDPSNPNNLVGFEIEIAVAMAALMNIRQTQVEVCYSNLEQALLANQIDMVMNGWEKTSDREKTELFSDPYYRYGQQIIIRANDTRFASTPNPQDVSVLAGLTVGTGAGYLAQTIMEDYNSAVSSASQKINIKAYAGNIAFSDLVQNKLDAFFLDSPIAAYYILGSGPGATPIPQLKLLGTPIYKDNYYVGFNKSNPNSTILLPEINQCFNVLKQNGTLRRIYTKWKMWDTDQASIGVQ